MHLISFSMNFCDMNLTSTCAGSEVPICLSGTNSTCPQLNGTVLEAWTDLSKCPEIENNGVVKIGVSMVIVSILLAIL